jgi:hypothetical protein
MKMVGHKTVNVYQRYTIAEVIYVCDQGNVRFILSAEQIPNAIRVAYNKLIPGLRRDVSVLCTLRRWHIDLLLWLRAGDKGAQSRRD